MWPTLGPFKAYGLFYFAAFLAHFLVSWRIARRLALPWQVWVAVSLLFLLGSTLGAKIMYDLIHGQFDWQTLFAFRHYRHGYWGGLLVYLGLAVPAAWLLSKSWRPAVDLVALTVPLPFLLAKLGCLLNGCCYGRPSSLPWAIVFPEVSHGAPPGLPRHPTQIYEMIIMGPAACDPALDEELNAAQTPFEQDARPLWHTVRCLLAGCGIIAAITEVTFYRSRMQFPAWFSPLFLAGMVLFLTMIGFYLWAIHRHSSILVSSPSCRASWIWILAILSVLCSSSLHQFAPFRPDFLFDDWSKQIPPFLKFMHYNLALTGLSLLIVAVLAFMYYRGRRRLATMGLLAVAGIMLVPNDDCPNYFNQPWLSWMGASPLMFLGNSMVLLVGYCGLHGIWPRLSVLAMGMINAGVLLLGLGHSTGIVW